MLADHARRAQLRRLRHRDRMVGPRRCDHAGTVAVELSRRAGDHVAHAVDEPHGAARALIERDVHGLLGHELRLGGHHRAAAAALRQLILGALAAVDIVDVRDDLRFHEALDEGRFAGAHRADDTDIDVARRARGDVLIDAGICGHSDLLRILTVLASLYERSARGMTSQKRKRASRLFSREIFSGGTE